MKYNILLMLFLILIPLSSGALELGDISDERIVGIVTPEPPLNESNLSVLSANIWNTTNQGPLSSTAQIDHDLTNNLDNSVWGHTFSVNQDFNGISLFNINQINATTFNGGFTNQSVLFADSSGNIVEDIGELSWDGEIFFIGNLIGVSRTQPSGINLGGEFSGSNMTTCKFWIFEDFANNDICFGISAANLNLILENPAHNLNYVFGGVNVMTHDGGTGDLLQKVGKIAFIQTDLNEFITSENNGDVDIGATTSIDFEINNFEEVTITTNGLEVDSNSNTRALRLHGTAFFAQIMDVYVAGGGAGTFNLIAGSGSDQYFDWYSENDCFSQVWRDGSGASTTYTGGYHTDDTIDFWGLLVNGVCKSAKLGDGWQLDENNNEWISNSSTIGTFLNVTEDVFVGGNITANAINVTRYDLDFDVFLSSNSSGCWELNSAPNSTGSRTKFSGCPPAG